MSFGWFPSSVGNRGGDDMSPLCEMAYCKGCESGSAILSKPEKVCGEARYPVPESSQNG